MENTIFDLMETHDYENILFCQEKTLGLKAIIVIHESVIAIDDQYQAASVPASPACYSHSLVVPLPLLLKTRQRRFYHQELGNSQDHREIAAASLPTAQTDLAQSAARFASRQY